VSPIGRGSILSRIWNKPSITVTGIDAPSVKNASNTLSPEVSVVISMRVAPGQPAREAYAALEAHLRAHAPFGAELSFRDVDCGDAFLVDTSGAAVTSARRAAGGLRRRAGRHRRRRIDPVHRRPRARVPGRQILVTGVEDPHARAHSPNESLHLDTFRRALVSEALLLEELDRG
jgi:acetylornithine deacetylase/succinyl-diaminopimelate desuccinylase-like protein